MSTQTDPHPDLQAPPPRDRQRQPHPTREQVAAVELGQTRVRPFTAALLVGAFLMSIIAVPVWQHVYEIRRNLDQGSERAEAAWYEVLPYEYEVLKLVPGARDLRAIDDGFWPALAILPSEGELKSFENTLEDRAVLAQVMIPPVQALRSRLGGTGNDQAYTGRDGWLFYAPGVDYLTGKPFLESERMREITRFSDIQPDPVKAIVHFRDQLAARDIELVVMPIPVKPQVHPEKLSERYAGRESLLQNPSYETFRQCLEADGVTVYDPSDLLMQRKRQRDQAQYLKTDTHWRPEAMRAVASDLAEMLRARYDLPAGDAARYARATETVRNIGDIAVMLKLPDDDSGWFNPAADMYPPEQVTIRPVRTADGDPWQPRDDAPVMVLGDSFSNIYSLEAMHWGAHAGFVEQLSDALELPVDRIVINNDGAYSTRQRLRNELRRGTDRLANKQVVVYQFAMRELLVGDWKMLEVPKVERASAQPMPAGDLVVRGTVHDIAQPQPANESPYREAVISIHLTNIEVLEGELDIDELLIFTMGMSDNEWTSAAELETGSTVVLPLTPWREVSDEYGALEMRTLNTATDFLTPWWTDADAIREGTQR